MHGFTGILMHGFTGIHGCTHGLYIASNRQTHTNASSRSVLATNTPHQSAHVHVAAAALLKAQEIASFSQEQGSGPQVAAAMHLVA